jgi:periplasmic divalent cation tolerance protein
MKNHENFCIIITSCNNKEIKDNIVKILLKKKLAACIQVSNAESSYVFKGKVHNDDEIIIKIKTRLSLYSKVEEIIKELHDYQIPQIIAVPMLKVSDDYKKWLDENLASNTSCDTKDHF